MANQYCLYQGSILCQYYIFFGNTSNQIAIVLNIGFTLKTTIIEILKIFGMKFQYSKNIAIGKIGSDMMKYVLPLLLEYWQNVNIWKLGAHSMLLWPI